ncbi:MAG: hypothetical protein ACE1ZO_04725 [Nitrospirales bacterium]
MEMLKKAASGVFVRGVMAKGVGQVDEFLEGHRFGTTFGINVL